MPAARKKPGRLEPVKCANVGCENVVPVHEQPQDRSFGVFCEPCLREATPLYQRKGKGQT
jgi:hypothetical protein